jgi:hypothetical protein
VRKQVLARAAWPRCVIYALVIALLACSIVLLDATEARVSFRARAATIGGCQIFPANNIWNTDISRLPVNAHSASYVASIGLSGHLHPDFGAGLYNGGPIGFPYAVVPGSQPLVPVSFQYASESDSGPYPIPANVPIEGGSQSSGDRHVLVVDSGNCKLYEMFASYRQTDGSWHAGSGAVWNLNSNSLRPATWTSADAAGLPILPGLVNYNDILSGAIHHALRFTVSQTQNTFLWPARHEASSSSNPNLPPMGLRLRLKASVNISSFSRTNQIILTALKHYGMFVADNGSSWFLSGTSDNRWNNDDLHALTSIPGSDFEAVDESSLRVSANSAQAKTVPASTATPTHAPRITLTVPHALQEAERRPAVSTPSAGSTSGGKNVLLFVGASLSLALCLAAILFVLYWRKKTRAPYNKRSLRL